MEPALTTDKIERKPVTTEKYNALPDTGKLAHWLAYVPTSPELATIRRRAIRVLRDKIRTEGNQT